MNHEHELCTKEKQVSPKNQQPTTTLYPAQPQPSLPFNPQLDVDTICVGVGRVFCKMKFMATNTDNKRTHEVNDDDVNGDDDDNDDDVE